MTLTDLQKIVAERTPGRWHVGHIDENLDRGEVESDGIIVASDVRRNDENFLCAFGTLADEIMEVLVAADKLQLSYHESTDEWDVALEKLKVKLAELK